MKGHLSPLKKPCIHPHLFGCFWRPKSRHPSGGRQKPANRILSINPGLHRPTVNLHILLLKTKLFTRCNPEHPLDKIDAGNFFSHRMLNLKSGIHLQKIKVSFSIDNELNRACRNITNSSGKRDRLLTHRLSQCFIDKRRRRFL